MHPLNVLYEDNHLLVINKPAGIATMGSTAGTTTLVTAAKAYLKHTYQKPGNVYLGVVSRLDAPVTGVVLFARTSKAAGRLSEVFRRREVDKTYWAVVDSGRSPAARRLPDAGELENWVRKDESQRKMVICTEGDCGAQLARLRYRTISERGHQRWLEIQLLTGRKHQIRVQCAARGWAILGDEKYGSNHSFARGIALHAARLRVPHPIGSRTMNFEAPVPAYWPKLPPGNPTNQSL